MICCIQKADGSNEVDAKACLLGVGFSMAWDQLKVGGEVSVIHIVSLSDGFFGVAWGGCSN